MIFLRRLYDSAINTRAPRTFSFKLSGKRISNHAINQAADESDALITSHQAISSPIYFLLVKITERANGTTEGLSEHRKARFGQHVSCQSIWDRDTTFGPVPPRAQRLSFFFSALFLDSSYTGFFTVMPACRNYLSRLL